MSATQHVRISADRDGTTEREVTECLHRQSIEA
jgi:hypothetical protein